MRMCMHVDVICAHVDCACVCADVHVDAHVRAHVHLLIAFVHVPAAGGEEN